MVLLMLGMLRKVQIMVESIPRRGMGFVDRFIVKVTLKDFKYN